MTYETAYDLCLDAGIPESEIDHVIDQVALCPRCNDGACDENSRLAIKRIARRYTTVSCRFGNSSYTVTRETV